MANSIPRAEHPNPQFERESWLNLNGEWEFEIDNSVSGRERGLQNAEHLSSKIIVPFCPESRLSGVENTDFMNCVWYRRDIEISENELEGIVILHFGAVDYDATVYINGEEAMHHKGGYVSFAGDITKFLKAGKNSIAVEARDDVRNPLIPRGKQSERLHSHDCDYTRTTGIWQTVWVEFVPKSYIKSIKLFPNPESSSVAFSCELCGSGELGIDVLYEGKLVGRYDCKNAAGCVSGDMKLIENTCGRSAAAGSITLSSPSAATPSRAISVCAMSALTALNISSTASPFSSALCSTRASTATEYTPLPMTAT